MSWNANEERLLCHIVLADELAKMLSEDAAPAFFRGFIVQNRKTSEVSLKARWKYRDGRREWITVNSRIQDPVAAMNYLAEGMTIILHEAACMMNRAIPSDAVKLFYPPDDKGDWYRTIEWLRDMDLIEWPPEPAGHKPPQDPCV